MQIKKTIRTIAATAIVFAASLSTPAIAADGLSGAQVLTTNTFAGGPTEGAEVDVGAFGMNNNLFATVGSNVEFPSFIGLYDIDIDENSISFNWVDTGVSQSMAGSTPEGNNDRNYFVFGIPAGMAIKSIEFDAAGSNLLDGSAEPTARVVTRNKIVTNFAAGVIRADGFAPKFTLTIGAAE